jgi:mono/diheme cytochrome c family protein
MENRRLIATVVAIGALSLGVLSACGGSDAVGTLGGEVTIGTGTVPTETPIEDSAMTTAEAATTEAAGETTAAAAEGDAAAGAAIFTSAGCGGCHTLAAAGSAGAVGPNLDEAMPDYALVMERVTNGQGAMPAYSGQLSEDDIKNVSAYVSQNAGK